MNQKEANVALQLGLKIRRPNWTTLNYIYLVNGYIHRDDGKNVTTFKPTEYGYTDWEIYHEPETGTSST